MFDVPLHIIYILYCSFYFHIYVTMCLFDVDVASEVYNIEKLLCFVFFQVSR
jgi:hypothetical protein